MKVKNALMTAIGVLGCCSMLFACGDPDDSGKDPVTPVKPPQRNEFVTVSYDDGNTTLSWKANGKAYDVYRADTKYGDYTLVEEGVTDGEYVDNTRFSYYKVCEVSDGGTAKEYEVSEESSLFGKNVYIFSPDDDATKVASAISSVYNSRLNEDKTGEFSENRSAFLLKSGTYDRKVELNVGYYMTFSGLGNTPNDVTVGKLYCGDRMDIRNALCNFWRGAENFTVQATGTTMWATSQSASLRAVKVMGDLHLSDGSGGEGYASGGFLADCYVTGTVRSIQQQQWFSRNTKWTKWEGNMWNMCFAGIDGAPTGEYPEYKYTVEDTTSMREKPFLTFDETNGYRIAVPALRENAVGFSWSEANLSNRIEKYVEQSDIYFARSDYDTAATINEAFKTHTAVILTPGVYYVDESIEIDGDNKILMGMGLATVLPIEGNACLTTTGSHVTVAGILFDAGIERSDVLVSIGTSGKKGEDARLFDCYYRVGGFLEFDTAATCSLKIYSDNTVCDNMWLWRADHGNNIGWSKNAGDTGAEIYGDNVTAYTLMAEHYKKHNVAWYGNNGKVLFYQSEIAYDVPNQSVWKNGKANGYSSLHVDDGVDTFTARGLGVYNNFHENGITLDSAITVPDKAGITVEHACTVALNQKQNITYIVNETTVDRESGAALLNRYLPKYKVKS